MGLFSKSKKSSKAIAPSSRRPSEFTAESAAGAIAELKEEPEWNQGPTVDAGERGGPACGRLYVCLASPPVPHDCHHHHHHHGDHLSLGHPTLPPAEVRRQAKAKSEAQRKDIQFHRVSAKDAADAEAERVRTRAARRQPRSGSNPGPRLIQLTCYAQL